MRDPFFKMLTRSLATFMNAFTGMKVCCVTVTLPALFYYCFTLQLVTGQCTHLVPRMIRIFITFSRCILTPYFIHSCVLLTSGAMDCGRHSICNMIA